MKVLYTDRSRAILRDRCPRARYWSYEYAASPDTPVRGVVPKKRNLALVVGSGFHAGMESLLRDVMDGRPPDEDRAVAASLAAVEPMLAAGVEVDAMEQPGARELPGASAGMAAAGVKSEQEQSQELVGLLQRSIEQQARVAGQQTGQESPLIISFDQPFETTASFGDPIYDASDAAGTTGTASASSPSPAASDPSLPPGWDQEVIEANEARATGMDDYLRAEIRALVEGMVRGYARRRLEPLTRDFEVLEVEREGDWKLADLPEELGPDPNCKICKGKGVVPIPGMLTDWGRGQRVTCECWKRELRWMSRHDGLLLERSTGHLYLLSYKTTGSWDRRKAADAEIDTQGLSEAVDVENRMREAWDVIHGLKGWIYPDKKIAALVSPRTTEWLQSQHYAPPRITGVRYEYALRGSRREDKKWAGDGSGATGKRWVQDSSLIRAYLSPGITAEDARWAPHYEWYVDEQGSAGKQRRVDYRSWKKTPVWERMSMREWIDRLDTGETWPGRGEAFDAQGQEVDVLADQFVPPVVVMRGEDDMRDWLEQVETQEVQVAVGAMAVQAARDRGDDGEVRSLMNRHFSQSRTACSYPSLCQFRPICFGGEDIRRDPLQHSELYSIRVPNHPVESNL